MSEKRSFAAIREAGTKFKKREVVVEEWDSTVFVRELSAREQQDCRRLIKEKGEDQEFTVEDMAELLAKCLEDCDGKHPDPAWLADQPLDVLTRLTNIGHEMNGATPEAVAALEKNSETKAGETSSDSPTPSDSSTPI